MACPSLRLASAIAVYQEDTSILLVVCQDVRDEREHEAPVVGSHYAHPRAVHKAEDAMVCGGAAKLLGHTSHP